MTRFSHIVKLFFLTLTLSVVCPTAILADETDEGKRYDYFFMEAMMQREKGNYAASFDLLRHCIEINPNAAEAYYFLAQYYGVMKDNAMAVTCFKRAVELCPDNILYRETLAQAYIDNKQLDEAIDAYEALLKQDSDRDDVLEVLAQLYEHKGDNAKLLSTIERMELIGGKSERLSLAKSKVYTRMGNKKAAIEEMKALADSYPNDLNYRGMYADVMLVNGQEKKAFDLYKDIINEEPENSRAQMSLRAYYKERGDSLNADIYTQKLLANKNTDNDTRAFVLRQEVAESKDLGRHDSLRILNFFKPFYEQRNTDMLMLCASYMSLVNMPNDSINKVYRTVVDIAPDNAAARLQIVNDAWIDDKFDEVITLCQAARQYNPDEMAFYYYQGLAYYKKEENDSALATFQEGISVINDQSEPAIVSDFYAMMGDILYQKKRTAEAFAAYDSCLQWKDDNIGCLNNYAYYLSEERKDLDKAELMSKKTIEKEPKNATYLDTYAWILFLKERYAEAKIYIEQALENDADSSAVITEHAGDIMYENNDVERAVELWTQAAAKDPDNKLLARKIKQRKRINK